MIIINKTHPHKLSLLHSWKLRIRHQQWTFLPLPLPLLLRPVLPHLNTLPCCGTESSLNSLVKLLIQENSWSGLSYLTHLINVGMS